MGDKSTKRRIIPMVIEDEHGKVIYRCDNALILPHDLSLTSAQRTGDLDSLSDTSGSDLGSPRKKYPYESRHQKSMLVLQKLSVLQFVDVRFKATRSSGI